MAGINSRAKGCKNERTAAELVSKWTNRKFARTPSSGGLNWKSANSKGDIVCTTEGHFFPFCLEIKAHKEIDFSHLLNPKIKQPKIFEFWEQCTRDATKAKKIPILMMRYNGMPADFFFVTMELRMASILFPNELPFKRVLTYQTEKEGYSLLIIPSPDFFNTSYKAVKKIAKAYVKTKN